MSTLRKVAPVAAIALTAIVAVAVVNANPGREPDSPRLGRKATAQDIARLDLTIDADGDGLPTGSGTPAQGAIVFAERCEACHGATGVGGPADRLTGGGGTPASAKPIKTPASYWPYAPPLFDYIRRAMPHDSPQSLTNDETYAVIAYILSVDGVVPRDAVMNAETLPKVAMPNRRGFVSLEPRGFDGNVDAPTGPTPSPTPVSNLESK